MSLLETADTAQLIRLLDLFPAANLSRDWPDYTGKKVEVCKAVARSESAKSIARFVDRNFDSCRQHVHVFSHDGKLKDAPPVLLQGQRIRHQSGVSSLYLIDACYTLILEDPIETVDLHFLWPVRVELESSNHCLVRFVILEKDLGSYATRSYIGTKGATDESSILKHMVNLHQKHEFRGVDLHKGIKALWDENLIDAIRIKFKKHKSTTTEDMDEEAGLKATYPDVYENIKTRPIRSGLFKTLGTTFSVPTFSSKPSDYMLTFPRYTEKLGGTTDVVRQVLRRN